MALSKYCHKPDGLPLKGSCRILRSSIFYPRGICQGGNPGDAHKNREAFGTVRLPVVPSLPRRTPPTVLSHRIRCVTHSCAVVHKLPAAYFFSPPCIACQGRRTIRLMLAVWRCGNCPRHRDAPDGERYEIQEMVTEGSRKDKTSMISLAVTNARWRILSTAVLPKVSRENQLA